MANVAVVVETHEIVQELKRLGRKMENVPMALIAEGLITAIDDEIESKGRGRWQARGGGDFSPVTLKLHPGRRGGRPLLDTGELANMQATEGPDWVKVKSPAPYAGFHVTGASQKNIFNVLAPHELPKRDFLDIDLPRVLGEAAEAVAIEGTR
jgi:phage gpG-like protein